MAVSELDLRGIYARLILLEAEVRRMREAIQERMPPKPVNGERTLARITSEGQISLPPDLGRRLQGEGDTVVVEEVADGIVVLTKPEMTSEQIGKEMLRSLVIDVGRRLETLGIHDEEDLDPLIEEIRQKNFEARYGKP